MDFVAGEILVFDKPYQWTSFDLIAKIRNGICHTLRIKRLKVGHAGTLDPLATGVMVVCTGKRTKDIESIQKGVKEYITTLQLGATTASFDLESAVDESFDTSGITEEKIRVAINKFIGDIWQEPPIYSAVKVNGKRAYVLARRGDNVSISPKLVNIETIELLHFEASLMRVRLRVVCSKGTYIRALARDIGKELRCGAYLLDLRRVRVGEYDLEKCWTVDSFSDYLKQYKI